MLLSTIYYRLENTSVAKFKLRIEHCWVNIHNFHLYGQRYVSNLFNALVRCLLVWFSKSESLVQFYHDMVSNLDGALNP